MCNAMYRYINIQLCKMYKRALQVFFIKQDELISRFKKTSSHNGLLS